MQPLNLTNEEFCNALGLPRRPDLMLQFRELQLVKFFKIGKKYMYPIECLYEVQEMLVRGDIQIKTDQGAYYVALTKTNQIFKKYFQK